MQIPNVKCALLPRVHSMHSRTSKNTGWKAKELASTLLEETGVATIGGPDFGILGEGYIRLSYANSEENIERAIERITEVS